MIDAPTQTAIRAERAMLAVLDGSCQTPIAGLATVSGDAVTLNGLLAHPEGTGMVEASASGSAADAPQVGQRVATELLLKAGPALMRTIKKDQSHVYRVPPDQKLGEE